MKCLICKQAETQPGYATVTLDRKGLTFVVKSVPALICPNCGEEYVAEEVTAHLLRTAEDMARAGALVDIRDYAPV